MRINRILAGAIGLAMAGSAPLAATSAANAVEPAPAAARAAAAPVTTARESLPAREITSRMVKVTPHEIVFKGKVKGSPKYAKRLVTIQRRIGKGGSWKRYRRVRSTDLGNWKCQVGVPRKGKWFYRAVTPRTNSYRKSYSDVWYTYTI